MAIQCEFINFIIPIDKIDSVYSGGFRKFKEDHIQGFSGRLYHDNFLFRDGAMSYMDIDKLINYWESMGLRGIVIINDKKQWKDFCVVESMFDGPTLPCDWIEFDRKINCVTFRKTNI